MDYTEFQKRVDYDQWEGYTYATDEGTYTVVRACRNGGGWWIARTDDDREILIHRSWLAQDAVKQNWAGK